VGAGATDLALRFVPISAPLSRGIFVTTFVTIDASIPKERISEAFRAAYANEPFVRVPKKRLPEVVAVSGSNYVEVGFEYGPAEGDRRTLACFSAIDNLIKGGAGQAVQSMNIVLGLDETTHPRGRGRFPVSASGAPLVVKLGGEVIGGDSLGVVAADLAALAQEMPVVVVHGGGPQATKLSKALGLETVQIAGRRVTDAEPTLDVMKMVVAGKLNVDLCAALVAAGARPWASHGASALVIEAERRPPRVYPGAGPKSPWISASSAT
jgi:hypothetical protein